MVQWMVEILQVLNYFTADNSWKDESKEKEVYLRILSRSDFGSWILLLLLLNDAAAAARLSNVFNESSWPPPPPLPLPPTNVNRFIRLAPTNGRTDVWLVRNNESTKMGEKSSLIDLTSQSFLLESGFVTGTSSYLPTHLPTFSVGQALLTVI